ncbi:hypothetical protein BU24DRAFT_425695 [Aaosphaeria arxii CBS 175.79]|uniref:Uncharacterized protein n=1 Tax=Aaosphaeria arxii CBS 175.79 TaxID=1450172 RepID=A0A6A5XGB9_9PLEO|nr:uncharacterized protein BU24DRAFT_425695 [Aaosphaeria arxii CBS 175.79]KAF2011871.1 hypothetical protein BU24DRAFT_425695 [Aaosphaeria arxii CBS 175.79]
MRGTNTPRNTKTPDFPFILGSVAPPQGFSSCSRNMIPGTWVDFPRVRCTIRFGLSKFHL